MRREKHVNWVADYLNCWGVIPRLPAPKPTTIADVLEYLRENKFVVYRAPPGQGEPKFVCQGSVVILQDLVALANEHRAARQLPPFQLVPQLH